MEFVADQSRADELLDKWLSKDNSRAFYLDFEADNFHHYEELLCTAQICYGGKFYLFDAINLDLSGGFSEILRNKPLWLHGCDYDLYLLKRFLKLTPGLLFDTQIAARLCGFHKFGYSSLVEAICGKALPKDSQRADWTQRPLPEKMIKYAENDVRYLPQISDLLVARLEKLKRLDWFEESCQHLLKHTSRDREVDEEERWRISGTNAMKSDELNFVKALYYWRDAEAKKSDVPVFKVANNNQILDWAKELASGEEIAYPKRMREIRKNNLITAIDTAKEIPEENWPERPERKRGSRIKVDEEELKALIAKRDTIAEKFKIEGSCIASRKYLEAVLRDPEEVNSLMNWQRELLEM